MAPRPVPKGLEAWLASSSCEPRSQSPAGPHQNKNYWPPGSSQNHLPSTSVLGHRKTGLMVSATVAARALPTQSKTAPNEKHNTAGRTPISVLSRSGNGRFLIRPKSGPEMADFGGLGGPGGPGDPCKRLGATPPTFCKGLPGPRGRPDPQNDRFPILQKINIL